MFFTCTVLRSTGEDEEEGRKLTSSRIPVTHTPLPHPPHLHRPRTSPRRTTKKFALFPSHATMFILSSFS